MTTQDIIPFLLQPLEPPESQIAADLLEDLGEPLLAKRIRPGGAVLFMNNNTIHATELVTFSPALWTHGLPAGQGYGHVRTNISSLYPVLYGNTCIRILNDYLNTIVLNIHCLVTNHNRARFSFLNWNGIPNTKLVDKSIHFFCSELPTKVFVFPPWANAQIRIAVLEKIRHNFNNLLPPDPPFDALFELATTPIES